MTIAIEQIETAAKAFAERRAALGNIVTRMQDGIEAIKRENLPDLKTAINDATEAHSELKALIEASPEHFAKPRSKVFHDIKIGFQKAKGGIEFEDSDQVVKLIRKHFPDQADVLIQTKEKPAKDALAQLTVAELKKCGCTVQETGDVVFIRPADSDVDKLVKALIDNATAEEGDE